MTKLSFEKEIIYVIDLHTHFIPKVDDGSDSIEETIRMARLAVKEGVSHAILTPHHNRHWVTNPKDEVIKKTKEVEEAVKSADIPLTFSAGQEIRLNEEFISELFAGNYLPLDEGGKYYLVEFSWKDFPPFAKGYLDKMIAADITPVIAHPERQRAFLDDESLLPSLIEMGCIAQVTATSVMGGYTEEIEKAAHEMIQKNLIHTIASDAHNTDERPFNLQAAFKRLEADYGSDYKENLVENARRIFEGKEIEYYKHSKN